MDIATPPPEIHFAARLFHHPRAEVLVGHEENVAVFRRGVDDFDGVPTRHNHIRECLHARTAIDVGDDIVILVPVFLEKRGELFGRAGIREGTTGIHVGNHDGFSWAQNLRRFTHEMNPAKGDHLGVGRRSLSAEPERIPHKIGHLLNSGDLVVVRKDHRMAGSLEFEDFRDQIGRNGCHGATMV